jgi:hypothetical protein
MRSLQATGFLIFNVLVVAACASDSDDGSAGDGGGNGGSSSSTDSVYCCVLRNLANVCTGPNNTDGLNESIQDWRSVGNARNAGACEAMVNNGTLGCTNSTRTYDEQDAIVACS